MKRKLAVLLVCVIAVAISIPVVAFAAGDKMLEPVTTVEVEPGEKIPVIEVTVNGDPDPNMPYTTAADGAENESSIEQLAVSISRDFSVAVGNSWSTSFNTGKLFVEDHNAFKTIISDVTGKYKFIITDDQGYEYSSAEYTNRDMTFTTTNAGSSRTFTVYILNTGTSTLTGHVKISSYYNS